MLLGSYNVEFLNAQRHIEAHPQNDPAVTTISGNFDKWSGC